MSRKRCSICRLRLHVESFPIKGRNKNGTPRRMSYCRACKRWDDALRKRERRQDPAYRLKEYRAQDAYRARRREETQ